MIRRMSRIALLLVNASDLQLSTCCMSERITTCGCIQPFTCKIPFDKDEEILNELELWQRILATACSQINLALRRSLYFVPTLKYMRRKPLINLMIQIISDRRSEIYSKVHICYVASHSMKYYCIKIMYLLYILVNNFWVVGCVSKLHTGCTFGHNSYTHNFNIRS